MDRVNEMFGRFFLVLVDDYTSIRYQILTIIILLISKTEYSKSSWNWDLSSIYESLPLKLLAGPAKLTALASPLIIKLPSFSDASGLYMFIVINLQIINTVMVGTSIKVNCLIYPYHCGEGYPTEKTEAETEMVFLVLQAVMFLNMAFLLWFMTSMKSVLLPLLSAAMDFVRNEIIALVVLTNLIIVVIITESQNVVIVAILINMVWWQTINYVVEYPTINIMEYDFSIFLEDYEIENEVVRRDPRRNNPYRYRYHFMDPIDSEDEDLIDAQ